MIKYSFVQNALLSSFLATGLVLTKLFTLILEEFNIYGDMWSKFGEQKNVLPRKSLLNRVPCVQSL